ncbi:MAG: nucleotidyl transferase AbiEii/AbiGii toxin family protein [Gammaproteobacteria bacterium]
MSKTAMVFDAVAKLEAIARYTLVGGTALALHLRHRLSEDLDFAIEGKRLDRRAVNAVIHDLGRTGFGVSRYPYDFERQTGENDGFDLDGRQQDFNIGGVKVSFFIPEYPRDLPQPLLNRCDQPVSGVRTGHIRILNIETLALMKSLLLTTRTTTRDLFDIVTLVQCGVVSYAQIFEWHDVYAHGYDFLRSRLMHIGRSPNDPGVQPLRKDIPADFTALKQLLAEAMDAYEQQTASQMLVGHHEPRG